MIKFIRQPKVLASFENCKQFYHMTTLLTIYKSFIRRLFDFADVIYDQPFNASFAKKIESVQYNGSY